MAVDPSAHPPGGGAPPPGAPPPGDGAGGDPGDDIQPDRPPTMAEVRQLRAEARSWRLKYQSAAAAEAELDRIRDAGRSELERATTAAATATAAAQAETLRALRLEVGLEHGLIRQLPDGKWDATLAMRLQGTTREELAADAALLARTVPATPPPARRVPNASQNAGGQPPGGQTGDQYLRDLLAGRRQ